MTAVHRRHVYFLAGFDPKGASYYHGLYAREALQQAQVTGVRYAVGPRGRLAGGNTAWQVRCTEGATTTETTIEHVRWDDIVRSHWPRSPARVLAGSLQGYAAALASPAALRRVWQASPRTLVALAWPAAVWLGALALALAIGALVRWLLPAAGWIGGGLAMAAVLAGALAWERRLNTSWLLRIYRFAALWRRGRLPELQARLDALVRAIERSLRDPAVDEVLLVGYSVGSLLAASTTARLQQRLAHEPGLLDRFALLTLGNCIPLLGLMRGAEGFRAELAQLGRAPHVRWADYSSVTDWGSFAATDPLSLCLGPAGPQRPHAPHVASPRFHTMFPADEYATLVKDKRRMHLQYLMAGRRPAAYDYFAITAGPRRLADRLAAAAP